MEQQQVKKESISHFKLFSTIIFVLNVVMLATITGYFIYTDIKGHDIGNAVKITGDETKNRMILGAIFVGVTIVNLIVSGMLRHRTHKLGIITPLRILLLIVLIVNIALFLIQLLYFVLWLSLWLWAKANSLAQSFNVGDVLNQYGGAYFQVFLTYVHKIIDEYIVRYYLNLVAACVAFGITLTAFISWLVGFGIRKEQK